MNRQRAILGAICLFVWGVLAVIGKCPIEPFIECLKAIVTGVFTYHLALKNPRE